MRLVYLTLGWVSGVMLAANLAERFLIFWLVITIVAAVYVVLIRNRPELYPTMFVLLAFVLGGVRYAGIPHTSSIAGFNGAGGLTIEGVVVEEPDIRDERVFLRVATEQITHPAYSGPIDGVVLVRAPRTPTAAYGSRIRATGVLFTPAEYDTFSYADFLARSGVYSIMDDVSIEIISSGHGNPFIATLLDIKHRAHDAILTALPDPQAALLSGILLGNERGISPDLSDDFSAVGASHIIAISGFNMTIISAFVMGTLNRIGIRRWWAVVVGMSFIFAYTLLVGANAAVVRAAVMSTLLVIAPLFRRKTYVPASLAFIALIMSILDPNVLWDISFQLSFFATLGLALFVDPLSKRFDALLEYLFNPKWARTMGTLLNEPLIVTLAAQITTLPLIILYFQRLSLVAIPVNLLVIPVQTYLLVIGAWATILALFAPGIATIFYWIDFLLLAWSIAIVRLFADLPFAEVVFNIDARLIALYFSLLIGGAIMDATRPTWAVRFAVWLRGHAVLAATVFSGAAIVLLMLAVAFSRPDGYLHIWMLDMGHSNAVLVQSPNGAHMLVDGGRFPSRLLTSIGDRLPFYDREIEVLVITQPDQNEYGALESVVGRYDIGVSLTNGQPNENEAFIALLDALASYDRIEVSAGYTVEFDDGLRIEVLNPSTQPTLADNLNDNTLVLRLTYGDISFLLPADLSLAGQSELIESGVWPLASIMQLPQHGTIRSLNTTFVEAAQPQAILLQSDVANRRGDPNPDTLALVGDVPLFRTDEWGTIHVWTDGSTVWAVSEG